MRAPTTTTSSSSVATERSSGRLGVHDRTLSGHKEIMDTVTATPLRKPNASAISRLLAKAGFERGETEASSMRNTTYYTPGFVVRGSKQSREWMNDINDAEQAAGYVTVERDTMDTHGRERDDPRTNAEKVAEDIAAYMATLAAAGYVVEPRSRFNREILVVMGRKP